MTWKRSSRDTSWKKRNYWENTRRTSNCRDIPAIGRYGNLGNGCLPAILLKRILQIGSNFGWSAGFNVAALHHVDQFSIAQNSNGRRRGGISSKVPPGSLSGFAVLTRKDRDHPFRPDAVLDHRPYRWTHSAGGAPANRIHHHHERSLLRHRFFHIRRGAGFLNPG